MTQNSTSTGAWLVTGAAGFVGARFVESCNRRGDAVISVDDLAHFETRPEHRGLDFGTRVDREELMRWLASNRPKLRGVIHLGACTDTMQLDEAFLTRVNLEYSKALWSYCAQERLPFVYASSAATYGDGERGFDDDEAGIPALQPLNPYGWSKQRFDLWALEEERRGNRPPSWAGFKFFNVYGFGERHKTKMASFVLHAFDQIRSSAQARLFKSDKPGVADGQQSRDFVYVEDVVDVLWFALEKPISRGIYNLGSGQARSFLDFTKAAFRALGKPERIEFIEMPEKLKGRYQYFTQARMDRLREAGYTRPFTPIELGVHRYFERLREVTKD